MNKIYEILEVKKRNQLEEQIYKNFSDKECFNYNHCMKRKCKDCSKMKKCTT